MGSFLLNIYMACEQFFLLFKSKLPGINATAQLYRKSEEGELGLFKEEDNHFLLDMLNGEAARKQKERI